MRLNVGRIPQAVMCLGVACLGLLPLSPLSASEPKLRETLQKVLTYPVYSLSFSRDGKTLASGGDTHIELRDTASSKNTASLFVEPGGVSSVAFSPDGRTLASGSRGRNSERVS